jgi:hypothetical protein
MPVGGRKPGRSRALAAAAASGCSRSRSGPRDRLRKPFGVDSAADRGLLRPKPGRGEQALLPRGALLGRTEQVELAKAEGRTAAGGTTPHPPGVVPPDAAQPALVTVLVVEE